MLQIWIQRIPGLEVFGVHEIEEGTKGPGTAMFDAATGKLLFAGDVNNDVGRGLVADIDPPLSRVRMLGRKPGLKKRIRKRNRPAPKSVNLRVWWGGMATFLANYWMIPA